MSSILKLWPLITGILIIYCLSIPLGSVPALGPLLNPATGFLQNGNNDQLPVPKGLFTQPVEIVLDNHLIPHIFSQNDEDLYRAQGYIHAAHRLWQMEFMSYVASGSVSEIIGEKALEFDKSQRQKGIARAAKRTVSAWKKYPASIKLLNAYVEGVNAYIDQMKPAKHPIEYKLLGYEPNNWSIYNIALFIKHMSDVLCSRNHDIELTNVLDILGQQDFDYCFPEHNPNTRPIIPKGTIFKANQKIFPSASEEVKMTGSVGNVDFIKSPSGLGSNNWAVSAEKTKNGYPILCNDPHLPLKLPSTWHISHLNNPDQNVMGVTFAGIPGIIIGFNDDIAWGVTNVGWDVLDWIEVDWIDDSKLKYKWKGQVYDIEIQKEVYKIKNGQALEDEIHYTHLGPVYYSETNGKDLILRWAALDDPDRDEMRAFLDLNKAKNVNDYNSALNNYITPAQNFAFASKEGDIALRVQGKLPIREKKYGRFVQNKNGESWDTYIPNEEVPYVENPPRKYVSSANQVSTDTTYPYYYISGDFRTARGNCINETLDTLNQIEVDDMKALQLNSYNIESKPLLNAVLKYAGTSQTEKTTILQNWDFRYRGESQAATLFELIKKHINKLTWDEIKTRPTADKIEYPAVWRLTEIIEDSIDYHLFDIRRTEKKESGIDIINLAIDSAHAEFMSLGRPIWSRYRDSEITHILTTIQPFGKYDLTCDGMVSSPNALGKINGPSWRMIVELDEKTRATAIYPGGQSGHPGSRHYDDLFALWHQGEYITLEFEKSKAEMKNIFQYIKSP